MERRSIGDKKRELCIYVFINMKMDSERERERPRERNEMDTHVMVPSTTSGHGLRDAS